MGTTLDDYIFQLTTDLGRNITSMSSGEIYAAQNRIKGLQAQNQAAHPAKDNDEPKDTGVGTISDYNYQKLTSAGSKIRKELRSLIEAEYSQGTIPEVIVVDLEIPENVLKTNPTIIEDMIEEVYGVVEESGLPLDYEITASTEVSSGGGQTSNILFGEPSQLLQGMHNMEEDLGFDPDLANVFGYHDYYGDSEVEDEPSTVLDFNANPEDLLSTWSSANQTATGYEPDEVTAEEIEQIFWTEIEFGTEGDPAYTILYDIVSERY